MPNIQRKGWKIFSCSLPLKIPIIGCTSNEDCDEPQPMCDIAIGKCRGCNDFGCLDRGTKCNTHTGRCVDAGLILNPTSLNILSLRNLKLSNLRQTELCKLHPKLRPTSSLKFTLIKEIGLSYPC